jgi:ABC-type dipeptide/oligopeptide/nickel transport system permease component
MTIIGLQVSRFLGAAVVVEAVFGISGFQTRHSTTRYGPL